MVSETVYCMVLSVDKSQKNIEHFGPSCANFYTKKAFSEKRARIVAQRDMGLSHIKIASDLPIICSLSKFAMNRVR